MNQRDPLLHLAPVQNAEGPWSEFLESNACLEGVLKLRASQVVVYVGRPQDRHYIITY